MSVNLAKQKWGNARKISYVCSRCGHREDWSSKARTGSPNAPHQDMELFPKNNRDPTAPNAFSPVIEHLALRAGKMMARRATQLG
jgi:hypothetical protein